ncbi:hypothetical protein, partial [Candidatus Entotheonella palauensis]|uniref:hypothetical protein n=1 Tax=Candidatus Entotheonella palauensis TaxID=93172 RepID=UPI001C4DDB60
GYTTRVSKPGFFSWITVAMLPALFTGQVVKKEGVVWVQKRPLYVGHRFAGLPAETIAISIAQAKQVGTQATFQVNVLDPMSDQAECFGFTWQGRRFHTWPPEVLAHIARIQPIAQRRVLNQAFWLPLTQEMLSRGWLLGDIGDLVGRVTDLGLGREAQVASYIEAAIRVPPGHHETKAGMVRRIKGELLEWLDNCEEYVKTC